jgi:tetratricopeptide (TPR) repeat protein
MRKLCRVTMFLLFLCGTAFSQTLKEVIAKGDKAFSKKDYKSAIKNYMQAYQMSPEDPEANFKVGVAYLQSDKKSRSLVFLEKAYSIKPQIDLDMDYHMAQAYQCNHDYQKAIEHYEAYKRKNKKLSDISDQRIRECRVSDSLKQHPASVIIENIGSRINSEFHEYSPLLSADGKTMIFTSNRMTEDPKMKGAANFEDIYITQKTDDEWTEPKKISENINNKFNDAAASLSHDGQTLFLYYEEGNGDI